MAERTPLLDTGVGVRLEGRAEGRADALRPRVCREQWEEAEGCNAGQKVC